MLRSVGIKGIGIYAPPKILTNFDLEKMVNTSDEWIKTRTGISARRIASKDTAVSDLALKAARKALKSAKITPKDLELLITASATFDMPFPATSCIIQNKLGAPNLAAFDLEAGCTGFIYALAVGTQFIANNFYDTALVVGADTLTKVTNWEDRNTCVLFGDGAGAVILGPVKKGEGVLSIYLGADGRGGDLLKIPAGGSLLSTNKETVKNKLHYIQMAGNEVFKFAVKIVAASTLEVLKKAKLKIEDIDCFVPHQANIRIIEAAIKRLGIKKEKVFVNVDQYGNTSCASIPIALYEAKEQGKIKKGDIVVLVGFGAGLTWGSIAIKWN